MKYISFEDFEEPHIEYLAVGFTVSRKCIFCDEITPSNEHVLKHINISPDRQKQRVLHEKVI